MISNAEDSWQQYIEAGCNHLTFHVESVTHLHRLVTAVTDAGVGVGVAINPSTPLSAIEEVLPHLDLVLVMTVNPGFGGQSFIADLKGKIQKLRNLIDVGGKKTILQVDGGVKADNIDMLSEWGVDNVVVGSGLYNKTDSVAGNLANLLSKLD